MKLNLYKILNLLHILELMLVQTTIILFSPIIRLKYSLHERGMPSVYLLQNLS